MPFDEEEEKLDAKSLMELTGGRKKNSSENNEVSCLKNKLAASSTFSSFPMRFLKNKAT